MNQTSSLSRGLSRLTLAACAICVPEVALSQATVTWGAAQDTVGPNDIAPGGAVVQALNGLVFIPYQTGDVAFDVTVDGVAFTATNYLGKDFPNEPANSLIANHTSGDPDYDTLIANLSSCDGVTLGNGSTDTSANYQVTGLTINENYLVQCWYTDVRGGQDGRTLVIDGAVTLDSGVNSDPNDLGQYAVGTFTATATTQLLNFDAAGTSGRAALSAIMVRVDNGGGLGSSYCGPAPVNSTGSPGVIAASGSNVASMNDVTLTASQLPSNAFGFFITGQTQGFIMNPAGSQGNLCMTAAIGRYVGPGQILNAGAGGTFSLAIDLTQTPQPTGFVSVTSGQTWNFQAWHRDSVGGMTTSNFTNGVEVPFL